MKKLTDYTSYADAQAHFSSDRLWELFDGNREHLNMAHECVDRYADSGREALIVVHAEGPDEVITFEELAADSSRFAHHLVSQGIQPGQRVVATVRDAGSNPESALQSGWIAQF